MQRLVAAALVLASVVAWGFEVPAKVPAVQNAITQAAPVPAQGAQTLPSSAELAVLLAQREAEVKELKAKLEELDDSRWFAEAEQLGVVRALDKGKFTEKQRRKLAVAIVKNARANGIDPLLVVAVIRCESSFNPYAVSGPGAMGLMQVMPDTGKWLATQRGFDLGKAQNLYDGELNVELGTAYLASLITQFGSVEHALVAYNAGPGLAKKILSSREARRKFIAGYPKTVVGEFKKLKAKSAEEMAKRVAQQSPGQS